MTTTIAPVTKTLVLSCTPERAFVVFTEEIETWWPLETHSVYGAAAVSLTVEQGAGGRIFETSVGGEENVWAEIAVWEPPQRMVFSWAPTLDKSVKTEVEVTFEPDAEGTRFVLVHRGWERFADGGVERRGNYDSGWEGVLGRFASSV